MVDISELLARVEDRLAARRPLPEAAYRLQFHAGFTFRDAAALAGYLRDLGVTHCYASPYLKAQPGSTHGYDVIDHRTLNPEIGTADDYTAFIDALHQHGLGQILDVVPNHMSIVGDGNVWWNDVLENGPASPYAVFFDISWHASQRPELQGRVLLPVLGDPYGQALEAGQLRLEYGAGVFSVVYYDQRFPLAPCSYGLLLTRSLPELEQHLAADDPDLIECQSILTAIKNLPRRTETDPIRLAERQREKEVVKRRLAVLTESSEPVREALNHIVAQFNGRPGEPDSFNVLDELLNDQAYRLAYWRVAADEINYRRFFDINPLAALSMERPEVFAATHELILQWLRDGQLDGVRIDHPDGLYDPRQYLERLQRHFVLDCARSVFEEAPEYRGESWDEIEEALCERIAAAATDHGSPLWRPLYVAVEKILGPSELLREDWPVHGTTGYEFLNQLNGLFVDTGNGPAFTQLYQGWTGDATSLTELVYRNKFLILQVALSSELHMLAHQLDHLAHGDRWSRDFTLHSLRHALREVIACFPLYRSYVTADEVSDADRKAISVAVWRAKRKNPALSESLFDFVRDALLLQRPRPRDEQYRVEQQHFVGKFQQVTSPVTAKGIEDTTFYVYNRLLSLNEVGGNPDRFGIAPAAVHRLFQERQAARPFGMSATSTHDTKRSEDVRARLNVLSEMPEEWQQSLARWGRLNREHRTEVDGELTPDANEEYLLYQTLLGAWPLEELRGPGSPESHAVFVRRIQDYVTKALYEAKVHTSWINPNSAYDEAVRRFVELILDETVSAEFLKDVRAFASRVSHYGMLNSLSQTLLKVTAPGVPDTYQGNELWDFSLVDPDNRRPVDFGVRRRLLRQVLSRVEGGATVRPEVVRELLANREDGRIKMFVTAMALRCRREQRGLFTVGEYLPVEVSGPQQEHLFAFARRHGGRTAVVVVPRLLTRLTATSEEFPLGPKVWGETRLSIPGEGPSRYRNLFTGEVLTSLVQEGRASLPAAVVLGDFPVALLLSCP